MTLEEADKAEHKVEDQWHYATLTEYGYVPTEKVKTGLVRRYTYTKEGYPDIVCTTGYSGDYWSTNDPGYIGGWYSSLTPYLKKQI